MQTTLKIQKKNPKAILPKRATEGSAGMDLYACMEEEITLRPGDLAVIPTGIAIGLPGPDYVALVFARSGLGAKHGISLSNGVGVIDSDYRGEIQVGLCNLGNQPYTIRPEERIAQLVVTPVCLLPLEEVEVLDETGRGEGGFGSTGTH